MSSASASHPAPHSYRRTPSLAVLLKYQSMSSVADAVRFCFPTAPIGPEAETDFPLYARNESQLARGKVRHEEEERIASPVQATFKAICASYAPDWIIVFVLWAVLVILDRSGGHKREFSLNDISIQHSFAEHERVPPVLLVFFSIVVPLLVLVPLSSLIARNAWDTHNSVLGLLMSYTMTGVVTQIIKMSVGRPRPDLIARCMPVEGAMDHPVFGLSNVSICTNTNAFILDDGFKSFPSGHSSMSFAGLGFLSLYLAGKMHLWDNGGHRTRAWAALSPLLGAAMVAISRTEDNRHHWQDVLVGSILGLFIAWVAYRTYYPPLSHSQCHLPLAPRTDPDNYQDFPLDDEEQGRGEARDRVRLLSEETDGQAREDQAAWQPTGR
ncbi:PAP2 domain-containing protein [Cryptococcus neoformans C23]|nr:PAP2 domain-containing protein [Cryptococcus neoformans var. grubii AD2-60a]OWZ48374.1 PAP2 domain-containing protein [Cryptococcus neoformans var. grubii C23]OXC86844.1 PAP2 domain-containing protein [Cryptococcus neoformans var. grubii AD1-7a]OXG54400.1 PAP2 domain-containing protein [Cryptococcus neoformans var. grubii Th84]OXH18078.1 PAP2 domain-containing protein [Cryptococcus neoformans var. grubii]